MGFADIFSQLRKEPFLLTSISRSELVSLSRHGWLRNLATSQKPHKPLSVITNEQCLHSYVNLNFASSVSVMEIHCWYLLLILSPVYWLSGKDFEGNWVPAVVSCVSASDIFNSGNSLGQLKVMIQVKCIDQSFCCTDHCYFLKKIRESTNKTFVTIQQIDHKFHRCLLHKNEVILFHKVFKKHEWLELQRDIASPTSMDTFIPCSNVIESILPIFKMYSDLCKCQATTSPFFTTGNN